MLGQNVLVYPDLDLVIVTNAGSSEIFQEGAVMGILEKYIGKLSPGAGPLQEDLEAARHLKAVIRSAEAASGGVSLIEQGGWKNRKPSGRYCRRERRAGSDRYAADLTGRNVQAGIRDLMHMAEGRRYIMDSGSVGFFPLMMQVFHNNYTDGIKKLWFTSENGRLWMEFTEGEEDKKFINFEKSNQYLLFLRNCDGLNVSGDSFTILKEKNHLITLQKELVLP